MRSAVAVTLLALLLAGCSPGDLNPVEHDQQAAGITIDVVGCDLDQGTGNVTMTYELESEKPYDVVLVQGQVRDGSGTIVGSSTGSVTNVSPGETYRGEMVLSSAGKTQGELRCEATLDLATEPLG